ncbi:amidohydrolase family protein [Parapusillimonas sp. SGNA-6]|nr:amidohydrolase family protein [Parapusillimonas sp. SGNA-6]
MVMTQPPGAHGRGKQPLLIRGAWVPEPGGTGLRAHDILVQDGLIRRISPAGMAVSADVPVMDASAHIVIPGLVNAHTHSHFALGRGYGDRWTLELHQNSGGGLNVGAGLEELRLGAMLGAADMIRHGCTAAYDMVLQSPFPSQEGMAAVAEGYQATGMRAVIAAAVTDRSFWESIDGLLGSMSSEASAFLRSLKATTADDLLAGLRDVLENWRYDRSRVKPGIAPSVPLLCSDAFLANTARLAREFDVPLQTHLAESKVQAIEAQKRWGTSLTGHLARSGVLGPSTSVAHAVWVSDDDVRMLADHGVTVAHNAGSNMRLGNGVAPVYSMMRAGLTVGIGTDACTCADQQNMIEAMRLASFASRLCGPDPDTWLGAEQAFRMATEGSAAVLGFADIGRLASGYRADMVFLDRNDLAYLPLNNVWTQLVFSETGRGVRHVMVDGDLIYRDGEFTTFDYAELRRKVEASAAHLAEAGSERRRRLAEFKPIVAKFCVGLARSGHAFDRYIGGG